METGSLPAPSRRLKPIRPLVVSAELRGDRKGNAPARGGCRPKRLKGGPRAGLVGGAFDRFFVAPRRYFALKAMAFFRSSALSYRGFLPRFPLGPSLFGQERPRVANIWVAAAAPSSLFSAVFGPISFRAAALPTTSTSDSSQVATARIHAGEPPEP